MRMRCSAEYNSSISYRLHISLGSHVKRRPQKTIGYFAGTKSHDKDLPIAAEGNP